MKECELPIAKLTTKGEKMKLNHKRPGNLKPFQTLISFLALPSHSYSFFHSAMAREKEAVLVTWSCKEGELGFGKS